MGEVFRPIFGRTESYNHPREVWDKREETLGFESSSGNLEEMIQDTWNRQEIVKEMEEILNNSDDISILTEQEIKKYSFLYLLNKIIESNNFSPELYYCSDYISQLIKKQISNYIDIQQSVLNLLKDIENPNFQLAGDIQLLRYMSKYDQNRKTPLNATDLITGAEMYYLNAYHTQKVKIGRYMYENLDTLKEIIDIRNLLKILFPQRIYDL